MNSHESGGLAGREKSVLESKDTSKSLQFHRKLDFLKENHDLMV